MKKRSSRTITVSLFDIAREARLVHRAHERTFAEWCAQPAEERKPEQLDAWIKALGETRYRMQRAEADARRGSRWIERHEKGEGR